ncbi:MAG: hypothetical protein LBT84_01655, partial [Spirochaetia bacterium]|nr:hypothetical protein [Spirochaetia bacterium]
TLHSGIGKIISHIKTKYPKYHVAVLTNSTLLWKKEVRDSLLMADSVIPSLDAVSGEIFSRMLRPAPGVTPELLLEGLFAFAKEYTGSLPTGCRSVHTADLIETSCLSRQADILSAHVQKTRSLLIEVFLIPGLNDTEPELEKIKKICTALAPASVQLNSLDRPGTESWVRPVPVERLLEIKEFFSPLNVTIAMRLTGKGM